MKGLKLRLTFHRKDGGCSEISPRFLLPFLRCGASESRKRSYKSFRRSCIWCELTYWRFFWESKALPRAV